MNRNSSILWNGGWLFCPLQWRMDPLSLGTKRDSFTIWKGGGLFRPLKRRRSVPLCLGMRKDSSILRNENGLFRLLKWRKVPLILGKRKASSIPFKWGRSLPPLEVKDDSPNKKHHHHHHRFVHSLKCEGILPSFEMKESPFIPRNEDRFLHIWKWNEGGPFHPLKWRRVPMSLAITRHSSILWNQWGLICRRSEGGFLDPRQRKAMRLFLEKRKALPSCEAK